MARARNIKPGFFLNEKLAEIEPVGRILFVGLWCIADRRGRLKDRPRRIKAEVLPYDDVDVDSLLWTLEALGFLTRYGSGDDAYIQIVNFEKHQNPHKHEAESEIPSPEEFVPVHADSRPPSDEHTTSTVHAQCEDDTSTEHVDDKHTTNPADSLLLIPDSLIPDPLESIDSISSASDETETEAPIPPRKTERPRNPWFEKLAECWLGKPYDELTLTKPQEKLCGMAASELKRINAPPEQIPEEWARISKQYENITPAAIPKHWNANGTRPRVLTAEDVYRIAE